MIPGKGDGTFGTLGRYPAGGTIISPFTIADLNGDNKPDIVTRLSGGGISVLLNNGSGALVTAANLTVGGTINNFWVTDLNGDNRPDVIGQESGGTLDMYMNDTHGVFRRARPTPSTPPAPSCRPTSPRHRPDICATLDRFQRPPQRRTGDLRRARRHHRAEHHAVRRLQRRRAARRLRGHGSERLVFAQQRQRRLRLYGGERNLTNVFNAIGLTTADLNGDGRADITGVTAISPRPAALPISPPWWSTTARPSPWSSATSRPMEARHRHHVRQHLDQPFVNNGDATFAGRRTTPPGPPR